MRESGTYALVIFLNISCNLQVGKLGVCSFPTGYYVYAGSALGGLSGRLKRHLRTAKKLHWHIDYLLKEASITQIWSAAGGEKLECVWNQKVRALPGALFVVPGFGASDCRCCSHLTYFAKVPSFKLFRQRLKQDGLVCQDISPDRQHSPYS